MSRWPGFRGAKNKIVDRVIDGNANGVDRIGNIVGSADTGSRQEVLLMYRLVDAGAEDVPVKDDGGTGVGGHGRKKRLEEIANQIAGSLWSRSGKRRTAAISVRRSGGTLALQARRALRVICCVHSAGDGKGIRSQGEEEAGGEGEPDCGVAAIEVSRTEDGGNFCAKVGRNVDLTSPKSLGGYLARVFD